MWYVFRNKIISCDVVFTDEANYHISIRVIRQNCVSKGSEPPREHVEHDVDSPKVNGWCALTHELAIGPLFL
jgi:hypothetical protein